MKKEYIVPNIEIVQFEISDIITHSLAMGDDSSGNNDVSVPGSWFNGRNGGINVNGFNIPINGSDK
ncbi:MAG: hypothetical protein J6Q89_06950 [Clostridia bacterium]|nr:hypothetical protein [Clostridia bacterium]